MEHSNLPKFIQKNKRKKYRLQSVMLSSSPTKTVLYWFLDLFRVSVSLFFPVKAIYPKERGKSRETLELTLSQYTFSRTVTWIVTAKAFVTDENAWTKGHIWSLALHLTSEAFVSKIKQIVLSNWIQKQHKDLTEFEF